MKSKKFKIVLDACFRHILIELRLNLHMYSDFHNWLLSLGKLCRRPYYYSSIWICNTVHKITINIHCIYDLRYKSTGSCETRPENDALSARIFLVFYMIFIDMVCKRIVNWILYIHICTCWHAFKVDIYKCVINEVTNKVLW